MEVSLKKLSILITAVVSIAFLGSFVLFQFQFIYKPTFYNATNITNYWLECEDCPPDFKPFFIYLTFGKVYNENILVKFPNNKFGMIRSASPEQPQTIGWCFCENNEIIDCYPFFQYLVKEGEGANYSHDMTSITCEQSPIPGY